MLTPGRGGAEALREGQEVMKISKISSLINFFAMLWLAAHIVGCVGSVGVDPSEDPVQPSENEEAVNEEAGNEEGGNEEANNFGENAGNGGFANEENSGNANNGGNTGNGNALGNEEGLNNATDEDFTNNGGGNQGGNNLFGNKGNGNNLGQGNNNNLGLNPDEGALVNNANADIEPAPNVNQGATDTAISNGTEEVLSPVSRNGATVSGNGQVRYVMGSGTKMYESPQGQVVKSLEQGDHPLVSEEGEWARTSDGFYVPSSSLSAKPIGRLKIPQDWR